IKGSSSTLYGGGAIAGLINMVSKTPDEEPALDIMLTQTQALGVQQMYFTANGMKNLVFHFMVQVIIKKRMTQKMMTLVTCQKQLRFHSTQSSFIIHRKKQHFGLA